MGQTQRMPLDPELNAAIIAIAHDLLPQGWGVSYDAPDSFERLKAEWSLYSRFDVFEGGCDNTIYADPAVNHAFRAWHDFRHLTENADFTPEGEARALAAQLRDLWLHTGCSYAQYDRWAAILTAEIAGQGRYLERHGEFPMDQVAFVQAYLAVGDECLAQTF